MITLYLLFKLLSRVRIKRRRTVKTRTVYARSKKPDPAKKQRDADRIRKEQFKAMQAGADLVHFTQVKTDLLKAYSMVPDSNTEKNIRKRIAYDNALRTVEKKIEKAAFDSKRTG